MRSLALLGVLGALTSCGLSSAAPVSRTPPSGCGPPGARTLAGDGQARVYASGRALYGCAVGDRSSHRLTAGGCPGRLADGPVALAGLVAAYALRTCGVDTSTAQVVVRKLSTGRQLSAHEAIGPVTGPESFVSVGSIAVRPGGDVAWIASSASIAAHRRATEVLAFAGGSMRELDSSSATDPRSLRLTGSRLTWRDGRRRRTARLG